MMCACARARACQPGRTPAVTAVTAGVPTGREDQASVRRDDLQHRQLNTSPVMLSYTGKYEL